MTAPTMAILARLAPSVGLGAMAAPTTTTCAVLAHSAGRVATVDLTLASCAASTGNVQGATAGSGTASSSPVSQGTPPLLVWTPLPARRSNFSLCLKERWRQTRSPGKGKPSFAPCVVTHSLQLGQVPAEQVPPESLPKRCHPSRRSSARSHEPPSIPAESCPSASWPRHLESSSR